MKRKNSKTETERMPISFGSKAALISLAVFLAAFSALIFVFRTDNGKIPNSAGKYSAGNADTVREPVLTSAPTVQHTLVTTQPVHTDGAFSGMLSHPQYGFTLTIAGRAAFESDISQAAENDKDYQYGDIFSYIAPYIHADHNLIFMDNLISVESNYYTDLTAPQGCLRSIREAGFDTVVLGNESILDRGIAGLDETRNAIRSQGLNYAGVPAEDGQRTRFINLNGANIAILSYSMKMTKASRQALETYPEQYREYDPEIARNEILDARGKGAMFVIVFMHWNAEEAAAATESQRRQAMELCSFGADLIIGNGTLNPIAPEYITAEDCRGKGSNTSLAVWSLGAVMTENRDSRARISSYLLDLDIVCSADSVTFRSVGYIPLYIWKNTVGEVNRFYTVCSSAERPETMNEKQAEYMQHSLQYIRQMMENTPFREDY